MPFEAISFIGNNARGWHDAWTDTWVIEKKMKNQYVYLAEVFRLIIHLSNSSSF